MVNLTLKLFGAVEAKGNDNIYISNDGFIVPPKAVWATEDIKVFYAKEKLNGNDLNKTFHKSWSTVINSTREELLIEQIKHYASTYGTGFKGDIYIPKEKLDIPEDLTYKVVETFTKGEFIEKSLDILKSGIALKEETMRDIITLLTALDYNFTGKEGIRNKEAIIVIADEYNVLPTDTMEFLRYIIYKATGETLLIKNKEMIDLIKESKYNPKVSFEQFGLAKLSEVFNRFKPLLLAFKGKCPSTINKISKLSKKNHKPLVSNPLNCVTNEMLTKDDIHWLDNTTVFNLLNAINVCTTYIDKEHFVYNIRNGKSYAVKKENVFYSKNFVCNANKQFLLDYIKTRVESKKVFLPKGISYAVPTSEKKMVGNIPFGTKVYGKNLIAGAYWENAWGAHDLDISAIPLSGEKIGWNSSYSNRDLTYSGDITNAPNGAVEYIHCKTNLTGPVLLFNNVYSGDEKSGYKIVVGDSDTNVNVNYMMDPNNLLVDEKETTPGKNSVIGMFAPEKKGVSFTFLNTCLGRSNVSGTSEVNKITNEAFYHDISKSIKLKEILTILDFDIVDEVEEGVIDLSLDKLEKDSFIKLFE